MVKFKPGDWVRDTMDFETYEFGVVVEADDERETVNADWISKNSGKWRRMSQAAGLVVRHKTGKIPKRMRESYVRYLVARAAGLKVENDEYEI